MGGLRARFCRRLRDADHRQRLRIRSPRIDDDVWPNVHSKLTIVDDRWAYIGSANFSNRSMGLDTECGLGLDGTGRSRRPFLRSATCGIRLLAEHLDVERAEYLELERDVGMLGAVDALGKGKRTLEELVIEEDELSGVLEPVAWLADPDSPMRLPDLINELF